MASLNGLLLSAMKRAASFPLACLDGLELVKHKGGACSTENGVIKTSKGKGVIKTLSLIRVNFR